MADTYRIDIKVEGGKLSVKELGKVDKGIDKMGKSAAKTSKSFDGLKKVAVAAFAAISAAAVVAAKKSLDAFITQEQAVVQLEGSLKALGTYTPELSQQFQDLADQFQATSRVGDEALLPMFSELMTIGTVLPSEMKRVTQAALDLSVITGSMRTSVQLLAKASTGYTSSLSRYGIILDDAIPESEKFGAVLEFIETRLGGLEREMTNTTGGAIDQMNNALGDLAETFGGILAPAVKDSADNLRAWFETFSDSSLIMGVNRDLVEMQTQITQIERALVSAREGVVVGGIYGGTQVAKQSEENILKMENELKFLRMLFSARAASLRDDGLPELPVGGGETFGGSLVGAGGKTGGLRGRPEDSETPLTGFELLAQAPETIKITEEAFAEMEAAVTPILQREAAEVDIFNEKLARTQDVAFMVSGAVVGAFTQMALGTKSAGDAMVGMVVGAAGQIATYWGSVHVAMGAAEMWTPGMQAFAAKHIAAGVALQVLGGTMQGLAGGIGGGGGGAVRGGSGSGSLGMGFSAGNGGSRNEGGGTSPTIILISGDGNRTVGTGSLGRRMLIDSVDNRQLGYALAEIRRTGAVLD